MAELPQIAESNTSFIKVINNYWKWKSVPVVLAYSLRFLFAFLVHFKRTGTLLGINVKMNYWKPFIVKQSYTNIILVVYKPAVFCEPISLMGLV